MKSIRVAITLLAALGVHGTVDAAATPPSKKTCFEYENTCYAKPREACEAVAKTRRADRTVENPYDRVVDSKDAGDSFWCKLADKNGNENEQHYGSKRLSGSEETCEEKHKGITECYVYEGQGMTLTSRKSAQEILARLNPGKRLQPGPMTEADKCDNKGEHWNYKVNGRFVGSILGCECCRNTNSGPVMERRYKASPN